MSFDLKLNQKKTNYISSFQKLTILTESYVHFLIMKKIKEKTVPNLCTDFGSEHVLFSHCVDRIHLLWRPGHLTTWSLTPEFWLPELWRLVAFMASTHWVIPDSPDFWRLEAIGPFDAPAFWLPNNPGVAFDAPITSGWHLTPQ